MNAVISGRAGLALVLDNDRAFVLSAPATGEPTPCGPMAGMRLFGDAIDLEFVEDTNLSEVKEQLDGAVNGDTALHLTLILLDPELSVETRRDAARELEELLPTAAADRLRNVMYAAPLSPESDQRGAVSICSSTGTKRAQAFLEELVSLQDFIKAVRGAWDGLDSSLFADDDDRTHARAQAVRSGLFRRYVKAFSAGESFDAVCSESPSTTFRQVKNHISIAGRWFGSLVNAEVPEPTPRARRSEVDWKSLLSEQVRQNGRLFYQSAFGILGDDASAQDVCQMALVRAWENRSKIDPAQLTRWISQTIKMDCLQTRRRKKIERRILAATSPKRADDPQPRGELRETIAAAVARLPEPGRSLIKLRYIDGMSLGEIGTVLERSESDLRKQIRGALALLREGLSANQPES